MIIQINQPPQQQLQQQPQITYVSHCYLPQKFEELHHYIRPIQKIDVPEIEKKWRNKLRNLQEEYIRLELELYNRRNITHKQILVEDTEKIQQLTSFIDELEVHIGEKQNQIAAQKQEIAYLIQMLQSSSSQEIQIYETEMETWKQKFIHLNREYHESQEQLIMSKAELESLLNRKVTQQISMTSSSSSSSQYK